MRCILKRGMHWIGAALFVFGAAPLAMGQIVEDGDIPWEAEWNTFALAVGEDPATFDFNSNGKPEAWEHGLAEFIIADSSAVTHLAEFVQIFNDNFNNLASENPNFSAQYGYVATIAICRGGIADIDNFSQNPGLIPGATWSSVDLTDELYTEVREVLTDTDPDADGVVNEDEKGTDLASYVTNATTSRKSYTFDTVNQVDLIDAAWYAGGQRAAFWGQLNNAGTHVAFLGVDYTLPGDGPNDPIETEIFLVELGGGKMPVQITEDWPEIPQSAVTWSPDDSRIFISGGYVDLLDPTSSSNPVVQPTTEYFGDDLNDTVMTARDTDNWAIVNRNPGNTATALIEIDSIAASPNSDGSSPVVFYGFDTDGDTEGWAVGSNLVNFDTAGGVLAMTTDGVDPYMNGPGTNFSAAANPYVTITIRQELASPIQLFWTTDTEPFQDEPKSQFLYPTASESFQTLTFDMSGHPLWTGQITSLRFDVFNGLGGQLCALPILPNGDPDPGRQEVYITNFPVGELVGGTDWPAIAPDFSAVAFIDNDGSPTPGVADYGNVYVVRNLPQIIAAPVIPGTRISSLAPTALNAGYCSRVREDANFAETPSISQDGSLILYGEDKNNVFRNADFFGTLAAGDWDVGITTSIGNAQSFFLTEPDNQAVPTATRGGTRILYIAGAGTAVHLFATQLETKTLIAPALDMNDPVITTTEEEEATDSSGTMVQIPPATTVTFPPGTTTAEIQIETPLSPVENVVLPQEDNAVPVVRDFGPDGTTFNPAIDITITYTAAEVKNLNLATLTVALLNETTNPPTWDVLDVNDIVSHDTVNRKITFKVSHFSQYGLIGTIDPDTDGDGTLDSVDTDDDGDGIADNEDTNPLDTDNDGTDNDTDTDIDGDGIDNGDDDEPVDFDNDGVLTQDDADADGDRIPDTIDLFLFDTDNDGLTNDVDPDDDGDYILDVDEQYDDVDNDGYPNHLDLDSDNDGLSDSLETNFGSDPYSAGDTAVVPLQPWAWTLTAALLALAAVVVLRRRRQA